MDRNELRQACQTAAAAIVAESYVPRYGDVVDAAIRTVLEAVTKETDQRYAQAQRDYQDTSDPYFDGKMTAFAYIEGWAEDLLPSTDSEAVRDGIR